MPRFRSNETAIQADLRVLTAPLRLVLAKQTKAKLVDLIVEIAQDNVGILRQLELRFEPKTSPHELIAATRLAITDATDFDEREINRNFRYDYQAYSTVKRNFERLIDLGHLHDAMNLSLGLMSQGSYQVEMSDEGLMTDDIRECLQVVIQAVRKSDMHADIVSRWCVEMLEKDRVGCICESELRAIQGPSASPRSR